MAEPLVLCPCSLALHVVDVDGPSGSITAYVCEHCDVPCEDKPCHLCAAMYRAATADPS